MPGADSVPTEAQRAELRAVLQSGVLARAPTLATLLSYLCERTFEGRSAEIKEYSIAVDALGRDPSFDQESDSIVRVQANRLRKRLAEYYEGPGKKHRIHISIPVGQYVPAFQEQTSQWLAGRPASAPASAPTARFRLRLSTRARVLALLGFLILGVLAGLFFITRRTKTPSSAAAPAGTSVPSPPPLIGLPVGDEVRILAGGSHDYIDHAGKTWTADRCYAGGTPVSTPASHIWRTQDPVVYRTSRQGEFEYQVPLKPGVYELHLHFAETFYGPAGQGGGGEGSRVMQVRANGRPLLTDFDVAADADGSETADTKVFTDISPAQDGQLHLQFASVHGGRAMVSAIEILPGMRGRQRPLRILTRDVPYYSNDSHWWSPDTYFKGGQLALHYGPSAAADDPELYESERWGRFSYAIPAAPGSYSLLLHFAEHRFGPANRDNYVGPPHAADAGIGARVFNVLCNGKAVLRELDLFRAAGENRPLVKKIGGLEPNNQGKLLLDFVPLKDYATVTAIEILPE
jgi:hypothetical protein